MLKSYVFIEILYLFRNNLKYYLLPILLRNLLNIKFIILFMFLRI